MVSVPLIIVTDATCVAPPVKPVPVGAVHVYLVPAGITPFAPSTGVILNSAPLHPIVVIAFTIASGLMLTVTVNAAPFPQVAVNGVTE